MENKFYKVMNAHSDEKLLEVYKNQADYNPIAIEAMKMILTERNLLDQAENVLIEKEQEDDLSAEAIYKKFQLEEFGYLISDRDFAQECLVNSIYFQKYVSPLNKYGWLNPIYIILGLTSLIVLIALLINGEFRSPFLNILILSSCGSLLLPIGIWKTYKNKALLKIIRMDNTTILSIEGYKNQTEIHFPFRYAYYWEWHYIKRNIKQLRLIFYIYDDKNDRVFIFRELLSYFKKPAPYWEKLPKDISSQLKGKSVFVYMNYGFQKPFLYQFQKIISGLYA